MADVVLMFPLAEILERGISLRDLLFMTERRNVITQWARKTMEFSTNRLLRLSNVMSSIGRF